MSEKLGTEWMEDGDCRDHPPETFFPSDGIGVLIAQRICAECLVQEECLDYAVTERIDHGVWGGTSERQRRRMIKKRQRTAEASPAELPEAE
ncbi:MAG: WhiB family transcriptional regulator [Candidatus Saccharibacteria bacterium]|nr:WhiB family transcriptional regulator [Candidatus Saccharibacteria bacterium]